MGGVPLTNYTAKMKHNESTIIRLAETQYNTFQFGKKLIRIGLALVLILVGLYAGQNYVTPMICLFVGCVLISGLNVRTRYNARKLCEQMKGNFPSSDYEFLEQGFKYYKEGEPVPYDKLIRLVEDKQYLYLYISQQSAYMVDKATVSGDGTTGLQAMLSEKTGLKWTKPYNLLTFRFRSIFAKKLKETGKSDAEEDELK